MTNNQDTSYKQIPSVEDTMTKLDSSRFAMLSDSALPHTESPTCGTPEEGERQIPKTKSQTGCGGRTRDATPGIGGLGPGFGDLFEEVVPQLLVEVLQFVKQAEHLGNGLGLVWIGGCNVSIVLAQPLGAEFHVGVGKEVALDLAVGWAQ